VKIFRGFGSVLFPCFFSKSRSGYLSCFDHAAQCRWPSFREASKLTFASSMKTAAGPLKTLLTTSETPTFSNELSKLYISSSCSFFAVRSRGAELIDLPRRGRGNLLILSGSPVSSRRGTSKRSQGRRTRGKSKSKKVRVLRLTRARIFHRVREKRKCAL